MTEKSNPYVTFITRSGPGGMNLISCDEPTTDGWAHWNCQTLSTLVGVLVSEGCTLQELWIGLEQQLATPISAQDLKEMQLAGVRLPLPPIRPGVVVRARVSVSRPLEGPSGPGSGAG